VRTGAAAAAALASGQAILLDLVTLSIPRRWYTAAGALVEDPAVVRWTSHDRSVRYGGNVFQGLPGTAWVRGKRTETTGRELTQFEGSVAGSLLVPWRTSAANASLVDQIDLSELAAAGLLEGARLRIDEAVLSAWPSSPEATIAADAVVESNVLVDIQSGDRDGWTVALKGASPMADGGASVPRSMVSPYCRWEYGSVECMGAAVARPLEAATIVGMDDDRLVISTELPLGYARWPVLIPLEGRNLGIGRMIGERVADGANWSYRLSEQWPWAQGAGAAVVLKKCSKMPYTVPLGTNAEDWGCLYEGNLSRFAGFPYVPASEDVS
jgi:hypothetical protein